MITAFAAAVGAALCYGVASVLEQVAARRTAPAASLDPRLLLRLARELPYASGLALDLGGWLLSLVALRTLPLFAVQAAVASSVGVTALAAAVFLHDRLSRSERVSVGVLLAGLVLLGASASTEGPGHLTDAGRIVLVVTCGVLVVVGAAATRTVRHRGAPVLGGLAGLAFGGTAIAARVLVVPHDWIRVLTDPVAWALAVYGALGLLLFATSLQRGSVTTATAALFAAETLAPAAIGVAFLGDRARASTTPFAVAGFVATLAAVIVLSLRATPAVRPSERAGGASGSMVR